MIHAGTTIALRVAISAAATLFACGTSYADTAVIEDSTQGFPQETGEQLYQAICVGCHMADAKGAEGAGYYPALADNARLTAPGYPLYVVTYGQKAMPAFGGLLTDAQIAEVVNYVRSHFGNDFEGKSTAADVAEIRIPDYDYVTLE